MVLDKPVQMLNTSRAEHGFKNTLINTSMNVIWFLLFVCETNQVVLNKFFAKLITWWHHFFDVLQFSLQQIHN